MDNVYEVYFSNEDTPLVTKTKERIGWICDNVKGDYVLDIGCSQGISSILLGREGKNVVGIDVLEEAIAFANGKLQCESDSVQSKVQFVKGDFLQLDIEKGKYDTVIMTEVLEHLDCVEDFVGKARESLKKDGIAIISVPFGINDYWDHKRTYYLGSLCEHLNKDFIVEDIRYIAKWLGVVCKVRNDNNSAESITIDIQTLLNEEEAFFAIERYLIDDNKRVREYNKDLKAKVDKWYQETLRLKDILAERKERIVLLNNKIKELKENSQNLNDAKGINNQKEVQKIERQKECIEKRLETAINRLDAANNKYEKISAKYNELHLNYDDLLAEYNKISNMFIVRVYLKIKTIFLRKKEK